MDDLIHDDGDGDEADDAYDDDDDDDGADDDARRLHCLLTCAAAHILWTMFKTSHRKRVFTPFFINMEFHVGIFCHTVFSQLSILEKKTDSEEAN